MKNSIFLPLLALIATWIYSECAMALSPSPEGARVTISNIEDGDTLPPEFKVEFMISGMGIAPAGSNIPNTGHHHLLVDVAELPPLDQPLPASENIIHFGKGQTETVLNLPPGPHSLQLIFADHTHTPHDPPVMSAVIRISVAPDAPPQASEEDDS
jgi:hypothetical protein